MILGGFAAIVSKLDNLGRDMRKLKENGHAIQVGCQLCEGPILTKNALLMKKLRELKKSSMANMVDLSRITTEIMKDSVDFVIVDMVEDFRMPIILGRPLLATAHAKVNIFRKSFLLEVRNEKIVFKMRSSFTATTFKYIHAIKTEIRTKEDDLMNNDSNLFLYDTNSCEFSHLLSIDPDVFTYDIGVQESYEEVAYTCCLITQESNKGLSSDVTSTKKKAHWCVPISRIKEGV
ncbi:hypothetical protein Tco_1127216 [Tanacetum coccineum]